ncbi:Outer membrane salicin receptor [Novosphingobium sp. Rr 2-17]|uniref:TonB-dependent receptor n=1 Tax=Novosphingobium sp. Rr 2-17 TaxID=555793 RepID=UPI0002698505|nr:TonB-dependent receptor [Novosphingobium sp. Rr 2-17]EIZ79428.1 Outer membrane salicin receptor [Novosphingobium sp. Rr 2-17]
MTYYKSLFMATSAVALIGSAATAQAQTAPDAQAPAPTGDQATTSEVAGASPSNAIQEIVVTAQRRSENLQRTAASVSVRTGSDLQASGKFALSQILEDVPGVTGGAAATPTGMAGSSSGNDSPAAGLTIRGIPSNAGVGGSATSIATSAAIYVDGIYNGVGSTYDIDRVEVLRGPQGTLYGRSATTGVVVFKTRNPSLDKVEGNLAVEAGNYDLQHYTGAVNVPLVEDKIALRVSGNYYSRDGYDTHSVAKGDVGYNGGAMRNTDYRAKLLVKPVDDLSILFGFAGQDNKAYSSGNSMNLTEDGTYNKVYGEVGPGSNKFRQYWAEVNWALGDVNLTYLPAFRTWKSDAINYGRVPAINLAVDQSISTPKDEFLTQELRLASQPGGKLNWQIGALYYKNDLRSTIKATDGYSGALEYDSDTTKKTTAAGVFGEATYSFTDTTRLNVGLRYDYTKVQVNQTYTSNRNLCCGGALGSDTYGYPEILDTRTLSGSDGRRSYNNVTYKVRLEHDLSPQNLIYALTSSGFSPGDVGVTTGIDGSPTVVEFKTETLTSYEIGTKNRFLDNSLQVNASAFYYVYGGYQVGNINISETTGLTAFTAISAPARAYGGEMEVLFQPTPNDRIGLNASYTNAYFVDRSKQSVPGSTHTFDYYFSRKEIPNVVPFRAQLNYDHDFVFSGGSKLTFHGDVRFLSSFYSVAVRKDLVDGAYEAARTGSQFVGDLTATWISSNERLSVSAYLRNVTDNRYKINAGVNLNGTNEAGQGYFAATRELSDPRTYGIVLGAKF